jgi:hypothetical protein
LYELATFNPPFEATNHLSLALKIKNGKVERIGSRYSEELNRVILWMLSTNQDKRPSIEDLLNLPQVSLRLRERRLKDNMLKLKKFEDSLMQKETDLAEREKEIEAKLKSLNEREEKLKELEKKIFEKEKVLGNINIPYVSSDRERSYGSTQYTSGGASLGFSKQKNTSYESSNSNNLNFGSNNNQNKYDEHYELYTDRIPKITTMSMNTDNYNTYNTIETPDYISQYNKTISPYTYKKNSPMTTLETSKGINHSLTINRSESGGFRFDPNVYKDQKLEDSRGMDKSCSNKSITNTSQPRRDYTYSIQRVNTPQHKIPTTPLSENRSSVYNRYIQNRERSISPSMRHISSNIQANVNMLRKTIKIPK